MAVTELLSQASKKSKLESDSNASKKKSSRNPSQNMSGDDSDLDRPLFQKPRSKHFTQHSQKIAHSANGEASDSETDIDKPPKRSITSKSVPRTEHVTNGFHSPTVNKPDVDNDSSSESDDEPQSMSLLQPYGARTSPKAKSSQLASRSFQNSNNSLAGNANNKQVQRRPNVAEMSSSEYESDTEEALPNSSLQPKSGTQNKSEGRPHLNPQEEPESESEEESEFEEEEEPRPLQTQPQRESESEEEEEEERPSRPPQSESEFEEESNDEPTLNKSVRVKEEVISPELSFSEEENPPENDGRTSLHPEKALNTHQSPNQSMYSDFASQQAAALSLFEMEHSPVSAPVVDIPPDSRVWVLQVPRSISADQLKGQRLPLNMKGGEIFNMPSGRWQILEQQYAAPESAMSCIVSTGNLSYGIRWLQPNTFWFLKRIPAPIHMESQELLLRKETVPLPIKDLLKMKTKRTPKKKIHSLKRVRDASPVWPSKNSKSGISEDDSSSLHSPQKKRKKKHGNIDAEEESLTVDPDSSRASSKHKKHKHHHSANDAAQENVLSVVEESNTEKQRKRKRSLKDDEVSPKKKRKKMMQVNEASNLDDTYSEFTDSNIDTNTTARDSSMSRLDKKKRKHKEKTISVNQIKQEKNTSESSDEKDHSNISGQQEDSRKRKKKKSVEEPPAIAETFSGAKHKDRTENTEKEKKKKKKHKNKESSHPEETLQGYEEKKTPQDLLTSLSKKTEEHVKKKKKKHLEENSVETSKENEMKTNNEKIKKNHVPSQQTAEDNAANLSVVKKKKKKHKDNEDLNQSKVKHDKDFWERETSPEILSRLYLTQTAPEDFDCADGD